MLVGRVQRQALVIDRRAVECGVHGKTNSTEAAQEAAHWTNELTSHQNRRDARKLLDTRYPRELAGIQFDLGRLSRLALVAAVRQVFDSGLRLLRIAVRDEHQVSAERAERHTVRFVP